MGAATATRFVIALPSSIMPIHAAYAGRLGKVMRNEKKPKAEP